MEHPFAHIQNLMEGSEDFVLTKSSWDGLSGSGNEQWEFAVLKAGPEWFRFQIIRTAFGAVPPDQIRSHPRWITWKDFGSFGIKVDGKPV